MLIQTARAVLGETMADMIPLFVAIIGSGALGVLISEWLRRKDNWASIAADLDVWAKLPDGDAKSQLFANIEHRLKIRLIPPDQATLENRRGVRAMAYGAYGAVFVYLLEIATGFTRFERHPDGLVWVHVLRPHQSYVTLDHWVMHWIVYPVIGGVFMVLALLGFLAWDREHEAKKVAKVAQVAASEDETPGSKSTDGE